MRGLPIVSDRRIYQALWIVPLVLFGLTIHQGVVAYDVQRTMHEGRRTTARVAHFELKSMAAQTHGILTLEYVEATGDTTRRDLTLPATFASRVRGEPELEIQVPDRGDRPPVILELRRVQLRMSLINTAMAALGTVLVAAGLWAWGRSLGREDEEYA